MITTCGLILLPTATQALPLSLLYKPPLRLHSSSVTPTRVTIRRIAIGKLPRVTDSGLDQAMEHSLTYPTPTSCYRMHVNTSSRYRAPPFNNNPGLHSAKCLDTRLCRGMHLVHSHLHSHFNSESDSPSMAHHIMCQAPESLFHSGNRLFISESIGAASCSSSHISIVSK